MAGFSEKRCTNICTNIAKQQSIYAAGTCWHKNFLGLPGRRLWCFFFCGPSPFTLLGWFRSDTGWDVVPTTRLKRVYSEYEGDQNHRQPSAKANLFFLGTKFGEIWFPWKSLLFFGSQVLEQSYTYTSKNLLESCSMKEQTPSPWRGIRPSIAFHEPMRSRWSTFCHLSNLRAKKRVMKPKTFSTPKSALGLGNPTPKITQLPLAQRPHPIVRDFLWSKILNIGPWWEFKRRDWNY